MIRTPTAKEDAMAKKKSYISNNIDKSKFLDKTMYGIYIYPAAQKGQPHGKISVSFVATIFNHK